ncbi:uncharacterized protein LOC132172371 [Corylus avellana]|uniref:uncharacterized protein LOC132172371 n=1 Tax=Corylus avellana TaxID=13451 RepID=UPI00286AE9D9|nr:uncharacterized protein LOC132172371 [Corylus avellana]
MAHDLWDMVEETNKPQEDDEAAFKAWSKKNFMALHVIQISCGRDSFSRIKKISTAKTAWDTLAEWNQINAFQKAAQNWNQINVDHEAFKEDFIKVVESGDLNAVEEFIKRHPGSAGLKISNLGGTALHVAVAAKHEHIVKKLVAIMSEQELCITDEVGDTALADATMYSKKLARYLYSRTPEEDLKPETGKNGATLCYHAICRRNLVNTTDIALDLIERCPSLALARDKDGDSPLYALVSSPFAFPSENRLVFWKRWIYKSSSKHRVEKLLRLERKFRFYFAVLVLRQLVVKLLKIFGIKDLYDMKLIHVQANKLLGSMCEQFSKASYKEWKDSKGSDAIFYAIENEIFKFVDKIAKESPQVLKWSKSDDERFPNALWAAIYHRQAEIFSLICRVDNNNNLVYDYDKQGNNILQMAGKLPPSTLVNRTAGAAFQMQSELQWYKAVESIVPRYCELKNKDGKTPRELFTESHKELVKEGEKWMKSTATSCTVVGALIVTIMFAAAFTVPGGNNQNTGYPMFLKEKLFMLFIISDSISLFSSSTSVLMFLGILTSRYLEEDFLKSLPSKMIIGLSTLFFSIATMVIAFSAALLIMLREYSWIFIPAICLASVPVTLFVWMQFPLLVEMVISTFGPGVVNRKIMKRSKLCTYLSSCCS